VGDPDDLKRPSVPESIAESISQGDTIEWDRVEQQGADAHDTGVLKELHLIDRIAAFHRQPDPASPTEPSHPQEQHPDLADLPRKTWAHFEIIEKIGEGVFGAVYRARDTKLQTEVALKLLWSGEHQTAPDPSHALKEARHLARVRHPNVVRVHGADLIDGRVGFWMDFVNGRTLADLLRTQGVFSAREAGVVGLDLCRALAAVHGAGLLHGDVKAHNVMREEGGRTVLMDFGTGKDLTKDGTARGRPSDDFAGTPLYLPPEVFEGRQRTKTTDIYSLGVLLYHLVTDSYPVEGRTRDDVRRAHRRNECRYLRDVRPDLPEEFVRVVERALASDPRQRYESAGAFEAALAGFLAPTSPVPDPGWRKTLIIVASAVAIVVALGTAYWAAHIERQVATPGSGAPAPDASPAEHPATAESYRIETALYRESNGQGIRLQQGAQVEPGAGIFAEIRSSVPTYVYVVNEDEQGESYLLFPIQGHAAGNPLPANKVTRLPGVESNQEYYWQVDKVGGREHFIIFASPQPLGDFEQQMFARLPHPEVGKPVQSVPLNREALVTLRSIGGLVSSGAGAAATTEESRRSGRLTQMFTTPLGNVEETVTGLWVRQLTVENPGTSNQTTDHAPVRTRHDP
jgi:eukaryotic-like serine/threonine-protein kinase